MFKRSLCEFTPLVPSFPFICTSLCLPPPRLSADRIYELPTQEEQDEAAAKATKIWNRLLKVMRATCRHYLPTVCVSVCVMCLACRVAVWHGPLCVDSMYSHCFHPIPD